jgi:hypothetical protein
MPHHRHSVATQDKPLNIGEIQRGLGIRMLMPIRRRTTSEQPANKPPTLLRRRMSVVVLTHGIIPIPRSSTTWFKIWML